MAFRLGNLRFAPDGAPRAALLTATHAHDLADLSGEPSLASVGAAFRRPEVLHRLNEGLADAPHGVRLADTLFACPVPDARKVFGIGKNYLDHATETGSVAPDAPMVFTKFPSALSGPFDPVELSGTMVDWEVELVVVIGTAGRRIPRDLAWSHVGALTLGQDISDRALQLSGNPPQFSLGKSFDGYAPVGPALCSPDLFDDPDDIELRCVVDGEEMQLGRTSEMIFDVPTLIAYLSDVCTLEVGDLIFTGTPAGVGIARGVFLRDGSIVESSAEVIGTMRNHCVQGDRPT